MDNIGNTEFYQGDRVIGGIVLPGERKAIKAEKVKKEEIYKDKIEVHEAFIASLGRKKEETENLEKSQPEYVKEKSTPGRKIFFAFLGLVILGALIGGGYLWQIKKQAADLAKGNEKSEGTIVIPVNQETPSDNSAEEKNTSESNQIAEVTPADLQVRVLNAGAAAGSAGRIKTVLVGQGYAKAEAGNGQGENALGSTIYYKDPQFKKSAEAIREILTTNKIKAEIKEALTAEQKSADSVVILGK